MCIRDRETSTEDTDAKSDENTVTGMISEITDSTITVAAMPGGGQGEAPGNPPSDNNGGAPAGNGNSDNNDSTEAPGKPDSDGADSTETPGNPPSGDNNSAPSDNGGAPDMGNMSTETINLTDSTVYYDKDGKETTLSALSEGTMATITLDAVSYTHLVLPIHLYNLPLIHSQIHLLILKSFLT